MKNLKKKLKHGFTLVEMIAVVAIIGILSSVLYVSYSKYVKTSRTEVCKAELLEICQLFELEMQENQTLAPTASRAISPDYFTTYQQVINYLVANDDEDLESFYEQFSGNTIAAGSSLTCDDVDKTFIYTNHDVSVAYDVIHKTFVED